MKSVYVKVLLATYPNILSIIDQIDELVEKKALSSMEDYSPCEYQCEKIITLIKDKDIYIDLKLKLDECIKKLSQEEFDCLDYKYLKKRPRSYYNFYDYCSRNFFRLQIRSTKRMGELLEVLGINDKVFESVYLKMEFFTRMLKKVKQFEESYRKKPLAKEGQITVIA